MATQSQKRENITLRIQYIASGKADSPTLCNIISATAKLGRYNDCRVHNILVEIDV